LMRPKDYTVRINSVPLHYLDWNRESGYPEPGEAALLLHGMSGNAHVWDRFAPKLASHMRTLALDLRGHGESGWASPPAYKGADYIGDIAGLLDQAGIAHVTIVAHSMSVYHAIRYAVDHPDRVRRMVLIDIEAKGRPEHKLMLNASGRKPPPVFTSVEEAVARERRNAPHAPDDLLQDFVRHNLRDAESGESSRGLTYRYDRATLCEFDYYDERENLRRIGCRVLLIYGKQSPAVSPLVMHEMAQAIPTAEVAGIETAGHLPHLDNPEAFERAVLPFCRGERDDAGFFQDDQS
jgi:3-oxoadipate enol-lactonase